MEQRRKKFKYVGYREKFDSIKVNFHQHLIDDHTQLAATDYLRADSEAVYDELDLSRNDGDATFVVSRNGVVNIAQSMAAERSFLLPHMDGQVSKAATQHVFSSMPNHLEQTYTKTCLHEMGTRFTGELYKKLEAALLPISAPLPELLRSQTIAQSFFLEALNTKSLPAERDISSYDLEPILTSLCAFARDLGKAIPFSFLKEVLCGLNQILKFSRRSSDISRKVEIISAKVSLLLYSTRKTILSHFRDFLDSYMSHFLLNPKTEIRHLFAECLASILRPLDNQISSDHAIAETSQLHPALQLMYDSFSERLATNIDERDVTLSQGCGASGDADMEASPTHNSSDTEKEDSPLEDEEVSFVESGIWLADSLSIVSFEIVKSIDRSINLMKFRTLLHFWKDRMREEHLECAYGVTGNTSSISVYVVLRLLVLRVKAYLESWDNKQTQAVLGQIEALSDSVTEMSEIQSVTKHYLIVGSLLAYWFSDHPFLYKLYLDDRWTVQPTALQAFDILGHMAKNVFSTAYDLRFLHLLLTALASSLPQDLFVKWVQQHLEVFFKKHFFNLSHFRGKCDEATNLMLLSRILSIILTPKLDNTESTTGLVETEKHLDRSVFESPKLFEYEYAPLAALVSPALASLLIQSLKEVEARHETHWISFCRDLIIFLARSGETVYTKELSSNLVGKGYILEAFMISPRDAKVSQRSLKEIASSLMEEKDASMIDFLLNLTKAHSDTSRQNSARLALPHLITRQVVSADSILSHVDMRLQRWLQLCAITDKEHKELEMQAICYFLEAIRTKENIKLIDVSLDRVRTILRPLLFNKYLRIRIATLEIFKQVFLASKNFAHGSQLEKQQRNLLSSRPTSRITELCTRIFDQLHLLFVTPDATDSAHLKINYILQIAQSFDRLITNNDMQELGIDGIAKNKRSDASDRSRKRPAADIANASDISFTRDLLRVCFYVMMSQIVAKFEAPREPAMTAVVDLIDASVHLEIEKELFLFLLEEIETSLMFYFHETSIPSNRRGLIDIEDDRKQSVMRSRVSAQKVLQSCSGEAKGWISDHLERELISKLRLTDVQSHDKKLHSICSLVSRLKVLPSLKRTGQSLSLLRLGSGESTFPFIAFVVSWCLKLAACLGEEQLNSLTLSNGEGLIFKENPFLKLSALVSYPRKSLALALKDMLYILVSLCPIPSSIPKNVMRQLEQLAHIVESNVLSYPNADLQVALLRTLSALQIKNTGNTPSILSRWAQISPDCLTALESVARATKHFESILQKFRLQLRESDPIVLRLTNQLLVVLAFSRLAQKQAQSRVKVHLVLQALGSSHAHILLAFMLAPLFEGVCGSEHTRNQMVQCLYGVLNGEAMILKEEAHIVVSTSESRTVLQWQLATAVNEKIEQRALNRLFSVIVLLVRVFARFRHDISGCFPFISRLSGWICIELEGRATPKSAAIKKEILKLFCVLVQIFPDAIDTHLETYEMLKPTIHAWLHASLESATALVTSSILNFVVDCARNESRRFLLLHDEKLLACLLQQMAENPFVINSMKNGGEIAVMEAGLQALWSLWTAALGRASKRHRQERLEENCNREKQKRQKRRFESNGSSSSDEEDAIDVAALLAADAKLEYEARLSDSAQKLISHHLPAIMRVIASVLNNASTKTKRESHHKHRAPLATRVIDLLNEFCTENIPFDLVAVRQEAEHVGVLLLQALESLALHADHKHQRVRATAGALSQLLPALIRRDRYTSKTYDSLFAALVVGAIAPSQGDLCMRLTTCCMRLLLGKCGRDQESRLVLCQLIIGACIGRYTLKKIANLWKHLESDLSPAKLVRKEKDLFSVWKIVMERFPWRMKVSKQIHHWRVADLEFALILHALSVKASGNLDCEGNADVQVSVLGSLNLLLLEKSMNVDSSTNTFGEGLVQEPTHLVLLAEILAVSRREDVGVQTAIRKFWDLSFARVTRLGRVSKFVHTTAKKDVEEMTLRSSECTFWKREQAFTCRFLQSLSCRLLPKLIDSGFKRTRDSVDAEAALELLHATLVNICPFVEYLPETQMTTMTGTNKIIDLFVFSHWDQESAIQSLASLLPMTVYEDLDHDNCLAVLRQYSEQGTLSSPLCSLLNSTTCVHLETVDLPHNAELSGAQMPTSPFKMLGEIQRDSKIRAYNLLRKFQVPSGWCLSNVLIPLCIRDAIQIDSTSQSSHNAKLSEEALNCLTVALKMARWSDLVKTLHVFARSLVDTQSPKKTSLIRAICRITAIVVSHVRQIEDPKQMSRRVASVRRSIIPLLEELAIKEKEKGNGGGTLFVSPEAVAALLQAVSLLPIDEFNSVRPHLIAKLAKCLASQEYSDRKAARVALRFYVDALGAECLPELLTNLQSRLTSGRGAASLSIGVSHLVQTLCPIPPSRTPTRQSTDKQATAIEASLDVILACVTAEMQRVADPSDLSVTVELSTRRVLDETRKKQQTPESLKVEAPTILRHLAAYLSLESLGLRILPGLFSLLNPSKLLERPTSLKTGQFSAKYMQRWSALIDAVFTGLVLSARLSLLEKFQFVNINLQVAVTMILEEKSRSEKVYDFKSFALRSLQDLEKTDAFSNMERQVIRQMIRALGLSSPKPSPIPLAQQRQDDLFKVQPGASTGRALYVDRETNRRGYELTMQGRHLGVACISVLDALIPQLGVSASESKKLVKIVPEEDITKNECLPSEETHFSTLLLKSLIDCFVSNCEEFVVPSGKALWRLQKLVSTWKQSKKLKTSNHALFQNFDEIENILVDNGKDIGQAILRVFRRVSSKPTLEQARQIVVCSDLLRFYFVKQDGTPMWMMDSEMRPNENSGKKHFADNRIRGAILAHVNLILTSPYHTQTNQIIKVSSLQLLMDLMKSVQKRGSENDSNNEIRISQLEAFDFANDELKILYSIFDHILSLLVQQAAYSITFATVNAESSLIRMARYAYLVFLKQFPLKKKASIDHMNKLIAYLSYEEPEGRKSILNCLNYLLDTQEGLNKQQIIDWLAEPLWLKGGSKLASAQYGVMERMMMKKLLERLLDRIGDSREVLKLLGLASSVLRDNMTALLSLTEISLSWLNRNNFEGSSIAELVKPLVWTIGSISISVPQCHMQSSAFLHGLDVPTRQTVVSHHHLVSGTLKALVIAHPSILTSPCAKIQAWVSSDRESKFAWLLRAALLHLFECYVPAASLITETASIFTALALVLAQALHDPTSISREILTINLRNTTFLGPIKTDTVQTSPRILEALSLSLRELYLEIPNESFFNSYLQGFGDSILALIALDCAINNKRN